MLPLLRGVVSGRLRRSLCTAAASSPSWAMLDRSSLVKNSEGSLSFSFARAPAVSYVTIPVFGRAFKSEPPPDGRMYSDMLRGRVLAASGHGFLLLGTLKSRYRAHPLSGLDLPVEVLLKVAPLELIYRKFTRFVCNPVSGQLFRLPEFEEAEKTLTFADGMAGMGLLTHADGDGPNGAPKRYAAAQLTEVDGGRRFLLRRFSSETGAWDERVLPSPMPPRRRMHMVHEVLDFGGRLWWVDVSWGAVCVDPFSDRPELCPVELPAHSMLPDQLDEDEMRQLIKHRHMGVSAGRLRYAEVDPFHVRSFTLDDGSGRWTLEHKVSVELLPGGGSNAKEMALVAAVDPLDTNLLHLNVDRVNFSVDMSRKRMVESTAIPTDMSPPSESATTSYLPCVLPSFLRSSPIPGGAKIGPWGGQRLEMLLHIRSFVLDDESGRWTLEHQVSLPDLWRNGANAKVTIAAIDPLNTDALHLHVDKIHVSVDMTGRMIKSSVCINESQMASVSYLPCVLPLFLWSSTIPGKNKTLDMAKNSTLADVLVRSDKQQTK